MNASIPFDSPLQLDVDREAGGFVVRLRGSATMDRVLQLRSRLVDVLEPEAANLIVDLSHLDFICSAGVGAIVAAHRRARDLGGRVRIVGPSEPIGRLLRMLHIDQRIPIHDDVEAARAAMTLLPNSG